ncbi:uncharacterized protein LOC118199339 [Stegodyphus dumicola]|uniref:uncharacterized protein LOC118199339 n=1 Tax=Stegodyphus dumicola TaxID=202533 RepID=UPI0015B34D46|nr:uncharacterized protein LOC118199339 [Stegodyphus dumicola]
MSADTVAKTFFSVWISRFGVPEYVTTDQGRQFESQLFTALTKFLGTKKIRTSPYHPNSNGLVERFHRSLKQAIRCHTAIHWVDVLPTVLLGLRTAIKEDLGSSSAEMVYGTNLRLPGDFINPAKTHPMSSPMHSSNNCVKPWLHYTLSPQAYILQDLCLCLKTRYILTCVLTV